MVCSWSWKKCRRRSAEASLSFGVVWCMLVDWMFVLSLPQLVKQKAADGHTAMMGLPVAAYVAHCLTVASLCTAQLLLK